MPTNTMLTKLNKIFTHTLHLICTDIGILTFCVVVPFAYPLVYAFLYTGETVRDVPTIVVDECQTATSRQFIRNVDATPDVYIMSHAANMANAKDYIRRREAYGIIYIPREFEKTIVRGGQAHVSIYVDMSGLLYYKAILTATTNVSLDMNARIMSSRKAIVYEDVSLYNPQNGFAGFLIPAVLVLIIQQTLILGIGMGRGTEAELKRFTGISSLWRITDSQLLTLGTALAFLLLYVPVSIWVLGVVPKIFSLNSIGNFWELWAFMLPYLLSCIFFAQSIAGVCRQRESIILLAVFTSVPFLFLSGVSWPGSNMPVFWRNISYFIPSTFAVNGYVKLNSMGAHLPEVWTEWRALWLHTLAWFFVSYFSIVRQLWPKSAHIDTSCEDLSSTSDTESQ